jgi:hypothetical protein
MTRTNLLLASVLVFGMSGSVFGQPSAENKANHFLVFGHTFFKSIKAKPVKGWIEKYHNSNSELDDEMHTRIYLGFRVEFIRSKSYPSDELNGLVLQNPAIRLPFGIALGDTPEKIIKVLGSPKTKKPDQLVYEIGEALADQVVFSFYRERLVEVGIYYEHE